MRKFTNPIVTSGADPWVTLGKEKYYYCFVRAGRIIVTRADAIPDLAKGTAVTVWKPPEKGPHSKDVWAPELHHLGNRWYIYFAADDGENANHRMYVLESEGLDPQGKYHLKGKIAARTDRWAIDGTVGMLGDHQYFVWSGWEGTENVQQNLYIAAMKDPWTLAGERACIAVPEFDWEKVGPKWDRKSFPGGVLEGPQFLERKGKVHIIYSANGSWTDEYCLGRLSYLGGDPLDRKSWKKADRAVFSGTDKVISPGHASFVKSLDGKEDWIVYHAAKRKGSGWDRDVRTQRFTWKADHSPDFGQPVPPGVELEYPSGSVGERR
jgi:GH43 family beta-xylosidase